MIGRSTTLTLDEGRRCLAEARHRDTRAASQSTGQLTTIGIALTVAWPARTAWSTAIFERRTRGVTPSFYVTMRTAHRGV